MASRKFWSGRVLIGMLAAVALIAIGTVPSYGATKKSTLNVSPSSAIGGTSTDFTVTLANTTPGNSTIKSASIIVPFDLAEALTEDDVAVLPQPASTNPNPVWTVDIVGSSEIRVNNIDPLKNNQVLALSVTATPAALGGPDCSSGPLEWTYTAYAGNSFNGDQFPPFGTMQRSTTILGCVGLAFVTEPHDAATDTKITGTDFDPDGTTVQVAITPSSAFDGATVTITEDGDGAITGNTDTLSGGLADFPGLQIDTAGEYNLTATVSGGPSTDPVAITIAPTGVCPDGVSGQQDFTTPEFEVPGQGTLNISGLTSNQCLGLDVSFTSDGEIQQWNILLDKPSVTDKLTGYATWTWDLGTGNDPVPWTEVKWKSNIAGELQETAFVDLPLCNAAAVTDPLPDPTLPNPDYEALFPTVQDVPIPALGTPQDLTAGLCMYDSDLQASGGTYLEIQKIALFEDPSGRK